MDLIILIIISKVLNLLLSIRLSDMKVKLIVFLCVALLPYNIYAADSSSDEGVFIADSVVEMNQMAEEGRLINCNFQPSRNGFLGEGISGFTYKGIMQSFPQGEVAMKFTQHASKDDAMDEFKMYTYLGSLHVPNIESYGIPKVYFFGKWKEYMMLVITLLDSEFVNRSNARLSSGQLNEVDILIAFREFVRITKYIHSKNIIHNDIRHEHLMFRGHQAFIIDFNMAHQMSRPNSAGVMEALPANAYADRRKFAREEWKNFLFSMCKVIDIHFPWFDEHVFDHLPQEEADDYIEQLKGNVPSIMRQIYGIRSNQLRRIFVEFAGLVFEDKIQSKNKKDKELFYDYFDRIIREEIANLNPQQPALVSWLTSAQRNAAIQQLQYESQTNTAITISAIQNPFALVKIEYPPVNYYFFYKKRPTRGASGSSGSRKK